LHVLDQTAVNACASCAVNSYPGHLKSYKHYKGFETECTTNLFHFIKNNTALIKLETHLNVSNYTKVHCLFESI